MKNTSETRCGITIETLVTIRIRGPGGSIFISRPRRDDVLHQLHPFVRTDVYIRETIKVLEVSIPWR